MPSWNGAPCAGCQSTETLDIQLEGRWFTGYRKGGKPRLKSSPFGVWLCTRCGVITVDDSIRKDIREKVHAMQAKRAGEA